jgi:hypothetical protein
MAPCEDGVTSAPHGAALASLVRKMAVGTCSPGKGQVSRAVRLREQPCVRAW